MNCNGFGFRKGDTDYVHFRAYRSAFLDGAYEEELLMPSNLPYLDKTPDQKDELILFANKVSFFDGGPGEDYTIINIYSVCDYALNRTENLFTMAFLTTVIAIFVEIVMALIFVIHKIRRKGHSHHNF